MADRPNVLMICTDHWPGRMIGALGHPTVLTPTLDQFIANGVAFTNAYATSPMCVPARRSLMTGTFARTHGDRFQGTLPMPDVPTLAQTFRDAGYQAYAVGKLHVHPPRNRIGFDDVLLCEESHNPALEIDDHQMYLSEQGYAGMEKATGLHNAFDYRPWHLPEHTHATNWTAREMSRFIARRDPTRPAFWYMSFTAPHPPFQPLEGYMDIYRDMDIPQSVVADWASDFDTLPFALKVRPGRHRDISDRESTTRTNRQAFYALSTHVDHQIRAVIGTLREQGIVDNTIILFTSDHGDMLGQHRLWNKMVFYEGSAKIPMILVGTEAQRERVGFNRRDDRLFAQADVMPTLLDLCDIPIPDTVEGVSMVGDHSREHLYGEFYDDASGSGTQTISSSRGRATRMVRDKQHKLVYYAAGNRTQLFDIEADPDEMHDLSDDPGYAEVRERLTGVLIENLYGSDLEWLDGGKLVGLPEPPWSDEYDYNLTFYGQPGYRFR